MASSSATAVRNAALGVAYVRAIDSGNAIGSRPLVPPASRAARYDYLQPFPRCSEIRHCLAHQEVVKRIGSGRTDLSKAPTPAIFIARVQRGVGTRQERSAHPAMPTHNPPPVLRSACGSHRWRGLRAIAPLLSS